MTLLWDVLGTLEGIQFQARPEGGLEYAECCLVFRPVEQLCLGCVLHGLPPGDATTCFCTWRFSLDALDCEVIELFSEGCSRE